MDTNKDYLMNWNGLYMNNTSISWFRSSMVIKLMELFMLILILKFAKKELEKEVEKKKKIVFL